MEYVNAFWVGGLICVAGQLLIDLTRLTPARIMGMKDRGMLVPGFRADIVLFDSKVHVSRTIVGGETVFAE